MASISFSLGGRYSVNFGSTTVYSADLPTISTSGMSSNVTIAAALAKAWVMAGRAAGTLNTSTLPTCSGYTFNGYIVTVGGIADPASTNTNKVICAASYSGNVSVAMKWTQNGSSTTDPPAQTNFTIYYNANGGSLPSGISSSVTVPGGYYQIPYGTPTRSGYSFAGWKHSSTGSIYQSGAQLFVSGNFTLTAQWTANTTQTTFVLSYSANGGTLPSNIASSYQVTGGYYQIRSGTPTRSGYTFSGWKYSYNNTVYQAGAEIFIYGSATLTAQWTAQTTTCTITFNANGGALPASIPPSVTRMLGQYTIPSGTPTRNGYTFSGWKYSYNNAIYQAGASIFLYGSATLTAQWTATVTTVSISFNSNGGSGTISAISGSPGVSKTLPSSGFTRSGYALAGWATTSARANAGTIDHKLGASVTLPSSSTTYYAVWSKTYSLTLNGNGGSVSGTSSWTGKVSGNTVTLSSATWSSTPAATFAGWTSTKQTNPLSPSSSIKVDYTGGGTFTFGEGKPTTLYAVFIQSATTVYVYFNVNGGTGTISALSGTSGTKKTIPTTAPTRSGYTFKGWATSSARASAGTVDYNAGSSITLPTSNLTLYAVWSKNAETLYSLTLSGNGGTVSGTSYFSGLTSGSKVTLPSATHSNSYYTFLGWSTSSTATSPSYYSGNTYTVYSNTTLFAVWRNDTPATKYTLSYAANYGTLATGTSSGSYTSGQSVTLAAAPTRSGYTFKGWLCSADSKTYSARASYTMPAKSVTMTAQWTATTVTPTLQTLGTPQWSMSQYSFLTNSVVTLRWNSVIGATGYEVYEGSTRIWYGTATSTTVSSTATGSKTYYVRAYTTNSNYTTPSAFSSALTITFTAPAQTIQTYTITYNANGGSGAPAAQTLQAGGVQLSGTTPYRSGYNFLGWSTSSTATIASYSPGQNYSLYSNVTFYAVWSENITYATVSFDANGGNVYPASKSFVVGQAYNSSRNSNPGLPTPSRSPSSEYTFLGWYTTASSSGSQVTNTTTCTGERTLYARWSRNAPAAPTWYTVNPAVKRGGTIGLTWRTVTSATGYQIRIAGGTPIDVGTSTTYNYTAPSNFNGTYVEVRACNSDGQWSAWSSKLDVALDKGSAPPAPAECYINRYVVPPTIFTNDPNQADYDVSWSRVIDPDGDLAGYKVYRAINGTENWVYMDAFGVDTTSAKFPVSALMGATSVQCKVIAYDTVGNEGAAALSNSVTVSKKSPPSAPPSLIVPDQSHLPVAEQDGLIRAVSEFRVSWKSSTDVDGDLVGYLLQEKRDDEEWGNEITIPATEANYTNVVVPRGVNTVQYRIQAYDALNLRSGWTLSAIRNVINNVAPTTPGDFIMPKSLKGGQPFKIEWGSSTDEDNNLEGYIVQRSLDGGTWEEAHDVDSNFCTDTIPKAGLRHHDTVAYRVKAYDTYGAESGWRTSRTYNISNNAAPVVTSDWESGTYIGVYEEGFSFSVKVTDEEEDAVDIEIALIPVGANEDAKIVLATMDDVSTIGGYESVYTITDDRFSTLPMQRYRLVITATDVEGEGSCELEFTRKGTRAFITLKDPMAYPEHITEVCFSMIEGSWAPDAIIKVEVTNNANDRASAVKWENCTTEALAYEPYQFKNKLAYTPAFNFRITFSRGPSGASGYFTHAAGCFETISGTVEEF